MAEEERSVDVEVREHEGEGITPDEGTGLWERYQEEGFAYKKPKRGDLINGIVLEKRTDGVVIDIGTKRDGLVPTSDLRYLEGDVFEELQVGDEVPVYVERPRDREGQLILSISRGRTMQDWEEAQRLLDEDETVEGEVVDHNRGGVLVQFGRIRGFVPASHLLALPRGLSGDERREKLASLVGENLRLKVLEVDRRRRRLVMSHRLGHREYQEKRKQELLETLEVGDVRTGRVTAMRNYGAFVDLGGADGLVHVSEVAHQRVSHPRQVLTVGDEVEVYVLRLDHERQRIGLSIKRLQPDPWDGVTQRFYPGQLVEAAISHVVKFGAFAELEPGIEGLIHVSQLSNEFVENPKDVISAGDRVMVRILDIDPNRQRISLSLKDAPQWVQVPLEELAEVEKELVEAEAAEAAEVAEAAQSEGAETEPEAVTETSEIAEAAEAVTEAAEPEEAEPQGVEPEAVEPDEAELQGVEPEAAEPEEADPQGVEPEAAGTDEATTEAAEVEPTEAAADSEPVEAAHSTDIEADTEPAQEAVAEPEPQAESQQVESSDNGEGSTRGTPDDGKDPGVLVPAEAGQTALPETA